MKLGTNKKIIILAAVALILVTTGLRCKFLTPKAKNLLQPIELTWWTPVSETTNFLPIISAYKQIHPNVRINIRIFRPEEFEAQLINALAEDRGPDMFTIHNTWLGEYGTKLQPLPPSITMAYERVQKSLGLKEETIVEVLEQKSLTTGQVKNNFLEVVGNDVVFQNQIWALPFNMDTLVMFYNRDLLDNAGLPLPPKTWTELQEQIQQLTFQNDNGDLVQAGVALGRSDNIKHANDILSLLMMQNGTEMIREGRVGFHTISRSAANRTTNPGPEALTFYTDFADPVKEVYSWNKTFPNSIDAFAQGKVAIIFGYASDVAIINAKRQGKLNFTVAKMPQIGGRPEINFASYWITGVSRKSKQVDTAWDFIQFSASEKRVKSYLEKTYQATALRSLITPQINDDNLNVFAEQLLTAQSWYHGNNAEVAANAFTTMITDVLNGADLKKTMGIAVQKINQTL